MPTLWFKVNQRALRDKLSNLLKDYISKRNREERDTGSSPEHREFDNLLEDICEKLKQLMLEKAEKTEEEKDAAENNWCIQWQNCQRHQKGKVQKVVLNCLRKK